MKNISISQNNSIVAVALINIVSLLAQIVQIGTIAPALSLFLDKVGTAPSQIGWVVSASWIAIVVLYKVIPYSMHRLGTINSLHISNAVSLIALVGMILFSNVWSLFCFNFLLGCGLIMRWIVCDTWLILLTNESNRGKVIGIHETLMGLGIAFGPLLIAGAKHHFGVILAMCIALILLSMILVLFLTPYKQYPAIPQQHSDKRIIPMIFLALFAAFTTGVVETAMIAFLPLMYIKLGVALTISTLLLASFGFGGALLQVPIGWLADKITTRWALAMIVIIAIVTIALLPYLGNHWFVYMLLFICGGCIGGLNTIAVLDASHIVKENQLSTAMILIAFAYTIGSIIGPVITGAITQWQSYGLLYISLMCLFLCLFLVGFYPLTRK